jgi:hypothetical protein
VSTTWAAKHVRNIRADMNELSVAARPQRRPQIRICAHHCMLPLPPFPPLRLRGRHAQACMRCLQTCFLSSSTSRPSSRRHPDPRNPVRGGASTRTASTRTHRLARGSTTYRHKVSTRSSRTLAASAAASGSSVECSRRDVTKHRRTAAGGAASGQRGAVVDSTPSAR